MKIEDVMNRVQYVSSGTNSIMLRNEANIEVIRKMALISASPFFNTKTRAIAILVFLEDLK